MAQRSEYDARHLSVLEGLEAVRKRPGMYIGSTDSRGLMHCLWEIIDNSVDEALAGYASSIWITLHPDDSVEVSDDGRGIPVDVEPRTGLSGLEVVFTKLHAGGKFGGGSYNAVGGLHGVGASVVNALSSRLDAKVTRAGRSISSPSGAASPAPSQAAVPPLTLSSPPRRRAPRWRSSARPSEGSPEPPSATGPTATSSLRTPASTMRSWSTAPGRPPSWSPGCGSPSATSAVRSRRRRSSSSTGDQ